MKLTPQMWFRLFVTGGMSGAAYDQIHVQGHVLEYPHAVFLQQDWWVAPLFGLASVVLVATGGGVARWAERLKPGAIGDREIVSYFGWFTAAYLASALLPIPPSALAALFAVTWLARVLPRPDRAPQLLLGVVMAVVGSSFEAWLTTTGSFHYLNPDLGAISSWLPGLYLHGGPLAIAWLIRLQQPKMNKP